MAGIPHTDSIIADSTASSSSPVRPAIGDGADSSNASTLVGPLVQAKRVGRTYGRPKSDVDVEDASRNDSGSRARILKTAPRDADDQIIPESDDTEERVPSFDGFDWRAKLKAIDEDLDDSGDMNTTQQAVDASSTQDPDASIALQDHGVAFQNTSEPPLSSLSQLSLTAGDERVANVTSSTMKTDMLFSASTLSSLLPSDRTSASSPQVLFSSSQLEDLDTLPRRPRLSHKRVIESPQLSDSENASPQHPFPINSPKQRSSPTPPTSPLAGDSLQNDANASEEESTGSATRSGRKGREPVKGKGKDTGKGHGKGKEKRPKAPTKKEVLETQKESARLLADQHVSIRRTQVHSTHTVASLFNKLKSTPTASRQDSDPITSFSSPGNVFGTSRTIPPSDEGSPVKLGFHSLRATGSSSKPMHIPSSPDIDNQPGDDEDSDEDMPEPDSLLRASEEKQHRQVQEQRKHADAEKRAKELEERKRKALEAMRLQSGGRAPASRTVVTAHKNSDDDDDLEVEKIVGGPEDPVIARAILALKLKLQKGKVINPSVGSEVRELTDDRGDARGISPGAPTVSQKSLELAAQPAFLADRGKKNSKRKGAQDKTVSHRDLNNLILKRVDKQSGAIEKKKKEQWVKAGGVLKDERCVKAEEKSMTDWLQKGASREEAMDVDEGDGDDDSDDPEYTPQGIEECEGSGSDWDGGEADAAEDGEETAAEQRMDVSEEEPDVDADKENHRPALRRQSARAIVDSDEEDGVPDRSPSTPRQPVVLVPDTSFTMEDADEDSGSPGEDKENSAALAFDLSEDKENARVPRHHPRGRTFSGAFEEQGGDGLRPASPPAGGSSPGREPLSSLDEEALGESALMPPPLAQRRDTSQARVLQVLHEEDKDSTLAPVTAARKSFLDRRSSSSLSPGSDDANMAGPKLISPLGFSQLFAEGHSPGGGEPGPGSALGEGGFSQFFSQGRTKGDIFDESPPNVKNLFAQRSEPAAKTAGGFEFTQLNALLPSVRISDSQRREVDDMFGKDQEFKLDEAKRSRVEAEAAPVSTLGPLKFGSFVLSQPTQLSPQSIRRPLETLTLDSATQLDASPEEQPFHRGRLLRERPRERETSSASPSPSPRPRNAFDVLRDAAAKGKGKERPPKQKLEKSDFVEAEAQESDEEAMLGFGGAKGDDEEGGDDDEDPDAIVEGLVDDARMDEQAQAAELVLEKHMEHQAADDAALTKLHQDAVDGKLRGKRRDRGIGFEDSDSDEEFTGPRKPLYKKRRVEGDTLDTYGENPETRPFYNAYQADLASEDDPTLAYLQQQDSLPVQDTRDDDSGEEESTEEVAPAEIRRQIREFAQNKRSVSPELDPHSTAWLDSEDQEMEDDIRIEVWPMHAKKATPASHSTLDHVDFRGSFKKKDTDTSERVQLKTWATQEARTHASASGRGGFSRKEEAGSSSRKQSKRPTAARGSTPSGDARVLTKSSSLLSRVEKRKGFGG